MSETNGQSHAVDRQCTTVRENGERCRGIPARGETLCHAHSRFRESAVRMTTLVPLLDDEASVLLVLSQTVRGLGQGMMPPANGRAMLAGCRYAQQILDRRLAVQKAALQYAALASKIGKETLKGLVAEFLEGLAGAGVGGFENGEAAGIGDEKISEPTISDPQSVSREAGSAVQVEKEAVAAVAEKEPDGRRASIFPGAGKAWDEAMVRTEGEFGRMVIRQEGEEDWQGAIQRRKTVEAEMRADCAAAVDNGCAGARRADPEAEAKWEALVATLKPDPAMAQQPGESWCAWQERRKATANASAQARAVLQAAILAA